jgi:hypothetical protein
VALYALKDAFIDFHANMQNGKIIIIELQEKGHVIFDDRSLFYASYTFSHQFPNEILLGKD